MLFVHPMWDSECQRIGKKKCTPVGYALHGIAELTGYLGLLLFLATLGYLGWKVFAGTCHASLFWLLAVPLGLGLLSELMIQVSWRMAFKKEFRYDIDRGEVSWMESGERHTYKH